MGFTFWNEWQKYWPFHDIHFFLDVPVLENILVSNNELKNVFSHVHTKLGLISSQIKV